MTQVDLLLEGKYVAYGYNFFKKETADGKIQFEIKLNTDRLNEHIIGPVEEITVNTILKEDNYFRKVVGHIKFDNVQPMKLDYLEDPSNPYTIAFRVNAENSVLHMQPIDPEKPMSIDYLDNNGKIIDHINLSEIHQDQIKIGDLEYTLYQALHNVNHELYGIVQLT